MDVTENNPTSHTSSTSNGKRTRAELKTVVTELRRQLGSLSNMIPLNINFRTLSDGRTRIYFLSIPRNGWETTLLYADIVTNNTSPTSRY